jgi:prepilin-type N-terminal cleavage/methylation domain-containing protein
MERPAETPLLIRTGPALFRLLRRKEGFSIMEILVALALFTIMSLVVVQAFISGMGYSKQSSERASATTLAIQLMEQVRASPNPYTMVGFTPLPRQNCCPLPSPWGNVSNPTPYPFQVSVDVALNPDLILSTVTVNVFRPADSYPFVSMTTVLKDL